MTGIVKAYASFGITLTNERWSWSGRTPDKNLVVLTIWRDEIDYKQKPPTFSNVGHPKLQLWKDRNGNKERIELLKWTRDHLDGTFGVVIANAKDVNADPREATEAYSTKLKMRLGELNETTGEFTAIVISS
jgi:hypothetical protein